MTPPQDHALIGYMETLELVGETLTLIEKEVDGNWYKAEDGEEVYISLAELRGDSPSYWEF